ncbi:MAG TPA: ribosome maturation factor RimM [Vicinamibacteria bacterium]
MGRVFADLVAIGRVVKPQGRRGEVLTEPLSDRPDRFPSLQKAFVPGPAGEAREVTVTGCWPHKGRFVLKLQGVDSIDAAEAFRGQELRIPEQELRPLPEGSFYYHELRGLRAHDRAGRELGTVKDILETGAGAPILVITGVGGQEELVPLAEEFVEGVDVKGGRLVVARHEWVDARAD